MSVGGKLSIAFCVAAVFLLAVGIGAIVLIDQLNHTLADISQYNFQMEQLAVATSAIHKDPRPGQQHLARLNDLNNMARTAAERDLITGASQYLTRGRSAELMPKLDELAAYYRTSAVRAHDRLVAIHQRAVIGVIVAMMDSVLLLVCLMYLVRLWLLRPLLALGVPAAGIVVGELPQSIRAPRGKDFGVVVDALNKLIGRAHELETRAGKAERFATVGEASSHVAHNLTKPLDSIRTLAEHERNARKDDADARTAFDYIIATVDTLDHWVRDMVNSTRPFEFRAARQQLELVVHNSLALLQPAVTEKKIAVNFDSVDGVPDVNVDPLLFAQAVCAVLANAIDAAAEGGKVTISLSRGANGGAALAIRDDGEGMTDDIKGKAFNPFFTTRGDRCGLGLTTAQRIVALHHGSIHIDSEPDKGTTVRIELPAAQAPQRPKP